MDDSRTRAGKVQYKPETSYQVMKQGMLKKITAACQIEQARLIRDTMTIKTKKSSNGL